MRSYERFTRQYPQLRGPPTEYSIGKWITFLATETELRPRTIRLYLSGLQHHYNTEALGESQHIVDVFQGLARTKGEATTLPQQEALTAKILSSVVATAHPPGSAWSFEDRLTVAAIATGIFAILRPGEFVDTDPRKQREEARLTLGQLGFHLQGRLAHITARAPVAPHDLPWALGLTAEDVEAISIHLRCSKTDQTMKGRDVFVTDPGGVRHILEYTTAPAARQPRSQGVCPRQRQATH